MATILVVDDEPDIRLLVRLTLTHDGHEVLEAGDGQEALDAVAANPPDLILLDVMMPGISGWDVLARLKAEGDQAIRQIPVVMLTALTTPLDRARGGIEGAVRYLAKPIGPDDLRAAVADAMTGEPEPVQRRRAQQRALEDIARMERGTSAGEATRSEHRPRLTSLEAARPLESRRTAAALAPDLHRKAEELTAKQQELLEALHREPTVLAAAASLQMSRSNVYASLRRIARRLDVGSVSELLEHVRAGRVVD